VDFDSIIFGAGRLWFYFQDQKTVERKRRRVGGWCGCGDEGNGLARPTGNEIPAVSRGARVEFWSVRTSLEHRFVRFFFLP
jgi:hypothetical protein